MVPDHDVLVLTRYKAMSNAFQGDIVRCDRPSREWSFTPIPQQERF